jgi:hypothetical protein
MYLVPLVSPGASDEGLLKDGLFQVYDDNGDATEIVGRLEVSFLTGFGQGARMRSEVYFVTSPEIQDMVA